MIDIPGFVSSLLETERPGRPESRQDGKPVRVRWLFDGLNGRPD
jgi:hypothetical protein